MKAVALTGIRQLEIMDVAMPELQHADDVLISIKAVGICGSDIHYYNEGNIGSQVVEYPWVVGHEASGEVVKTGPKVKSLSVGDKIAIEPTLWCGECEQCLQGRKHTCLNQKFLGCPGQIEGCMSEYFILPEHCCFKISEHIPYPLAVFAEPLSIGIYATVLYGHDMKGLKVGILGAGPIGQSVAAACTKTWAPELFVTDKIDGRLDLAQKMGAKWTGNPDKEDIVQQISEVEPGMLDVVFECCGKQEAVDQAVELLKPGGTLMMVGIPEVDRISVKMDKMRRKEIRFQNVRRQNECFQKAIDMIEADPEYFGQFITHNFDLNQAKEGFEWVRQYKDNVLKAIVEP
jgi:L-iditol 2-dehydrogenase